MNDNKTPCRTCHRMYALRDMHDGACDACRAEVRRKEERQRDDDAAEQRRRDDANRYEPSPMPSFSLPDFGSGGSGPDYGGSSGGGGASGEY